MKKILLLLIFSILWACSFAQTSGIKVGAPIIRNAQSDTYPTGYSHLINGGYQSYATKAGRDSLLTIYPQLLRDGMLVYCRDVDSTYRYNKASNSWITYSQGASITLTTNGTSGAATYTGGVLNIPQYAGQTYTNGVGLNLSGNVFSADTANILKSKASALADYNNLTTGINARVKYTDTTAAYANLVHKALTETITGAKTFNGTVIFNGQIGADMDLGHHELFAGAAEIGDNKPGMYGAGIYNTSATGNGAFIKGGAAGYHNTDFIDYNNNTVSYVLGTSTYTSADHLALTTKDYVDAVVNSAVSGIPAGVTSFNSRTGAVVPQSGDYSAFYGSLSQQNTNTANITANYNALGKKADRLLPADPGATSTAIAANDSLAMAAYKLQKQIATRKNLTSVAINSAGHLIFSFDDNTIIDAGYLSGASLGQLAALQMVSSNVTAGGLTLTWNSAGYNSHKLWQNTTDRFYTASSIATPDGSTFAYNVTNLAANSLYYFYLQGLLGTKSYVGKKIAFVGDSFTQQELYQDNVISITGGTKVYDDGIGGSCIATGMENAINDGTTRPSIYSRLDAAINSGADIVFIEGGSNDYYLNVPIGSSTDTVTTTFYGALNGIVKKINAHPGIVFIPITMAPRPSGAGNASLDYTNESPYVNAMISTFIAQHIVSCDVFNNSVFTFANMLSTDPAGYTTDNTHPNTAAGKAAYGGFVSSFVQNPYYMAKLSVQTAQAQNQTVTPGNIDWSANLINATFSAANLTLKGATGSNNYISGANATQKVNSGNATIVMPYNSLETSGVLIGFGESKMVADNTNGNIYKQIDFGAYYDGSTFRVFELGVNKFQQNSIANAKVSVQVNNGVVQYLVNDTIVYSSSTTPTYPLYISSSLSGQDQGIVGATITAGDLIAY